MYESDSHGKVDESVPEVKERDGDKIEQEMYKLRAEYYKDQENSIRMVSTVINYEADVIKAINGHGVTRDSPSILIDRGDSRSVCGRKWVDRRFGSSKPVLAKSQNLFRFGAGPAMQSLGTTTIFIHVSPQATDKMGPVILPIRIDVVNSDAAMLIPNESLRLMKGSIDYPPISLLIPSLAKIKLRAAKSGHLMIQ